MQQLPAESASVADMRGGPEFRGWGPDRYLMAQLIDAVNQNTHAFISANSKKKPKAPQPVERPDIRVQQKQGHNSFAAMAAARIASVRNRRKADDGEEGTGR